MKCKMTILNSEKELRKYVISKHSDIYQIIVFEDILDHVIFFYCFNKNNSIVATKEFFYEDFSFYKKSYEKLAKEIDFSASNYKNQLNAIRLVSKKGKLCI